jgi:hypothetical protein
MSVYIFQIIFKVDNFLDKMSTLTREDEQQNELSKMTRRYSWVKNIKLTKRLLLNYVGIFLHCFYIDAHQTIWST